MILWDYTCDRCQIEIRYYDLLRLYRLADGVDLMLMDTPVWCLDCGVLRPAEELPTAGSFERRIEALRQNRLEEYEIEISRSIGEAEWIAEKLTEAMAGLRWRRERRSPPRCLECGSTEFVPTPMLFDATGMGYFIHPVCDGTLARTGVIFAREDAYPLYDGEGKRLTE